MWKYVVLVPGCLVVAFAAGWASFATLAVLAEATHWPGGYWLLPTSIDALGIVACIVWLWPAFPAESRRFAQWTMFAALAVSVLGNTVGHLVTSGLMPVSVALIVLVGAVPPSSLAAVIHLLVLAVSKPVPAARRAKKPVAEPVPAKAPEQRIVPGPEKPKETPEPAPKADSSKPGPAGLEINEFVIQRVRRLDQEHLAEHGRGISRDKVRKALNTSNEKASEALRLARQEGVA